MKPEVSVDLDSCERLVTMTGERLNDHFRSWDRNRISSSLFYISNQMIDVTPLNKPLHFSE